MVDVYGESQDARISEIEEAIWLLELKLFYCVVSGISAM